MAPACSAPVKRHAYRGTPDVVCVPKNSLPHQRAFVIVELVADQERAVLESAAEQKMCHQQQHNGQHRPADLGSIRPDLQYPPSIATRSCMPITPWPVPLPTYWTRPRRLAGW